MKLEVSSFPGRSEASRSLTVEEETESRTVQARGIFPDYLVQSLLKPALASPRRMTDPSTISWSTQTAQCLCQALPEHVNPRERNGLPLTSTFMSPGGHRYEVCVSWGQVQPWECHLENLHDASYFWILYFILIPMANDSEVSQYLRTRNLIPPLKSFRSPYKFTRSLFYQVTHEKFILHTISASHHLKLEHRHGGEGQTPSHRRAARALGWLTLTPQLTSQTVM